MVEKIFACIAIAVGTGMCLYAVFGRIYGFHRPLGWMSGGHISVAGEISIGIFILCLGLILLLHSPIWVIPAIASFAVGFISQERARRYYLAKEKKLRLDNAVNYPGVFDNPPPDDIEGIREDELDLFDAGSCTYLGRASKKDVRVLIERFKEIPEQGPNDIYMLVESLEMIPEGSVSQEFITLLRNAFEKRDYLEIRWLAPSDRPG